MIHSSCSLRKQINLTLLQLKSLYITSDLRKKIITKWCSWCSNNQRNISGLCIEILWGQSAVSHNDLLDLIYLQFRFDWLLSSSTFYIIYFLSLSQLQLTVSDMNAWRRQKTVDPYLKKTKTEVARKSHVLNHHSTWACLFI